MDDKYSDVFIILITGAAFVIVVAGMRATASIINPFLLAIFIASLCGPLLYGLQRLGIPKGLAVSAIVLGLFVASLFIMIFMGKSLNSLSQQIPTYQQRLTTIASQVVTWLNSHGLNVDMETLALNDYFNPRVIMSLVTYGLSILRVLVTNLFLILLIVLFILLETAGFPQKLEAAFPESQSTLGHFQTITANVNRYMGIKAFFSLATGAFIWIALMLIGVDFAGTWGLLAFLLNFIPAIGSFIAAIPAIIWALVQLGLSSALLTLLAYLLVNIIIGNLLEPRFMGQRLGLSPLVVILSLIFWGWVLGPIGMLLSVPLTMIAKIALATDENTRWIAVLLE
jgi:predicted PurR-regulated permease PerM